ncbi:MAG: PDGLE domain-containing protein, partial [Acidobacteriota bacterium]
GMTGTLMLVLLAPLASADPDGLEAVAHSAGFSRLAQSHAFELMSGYSVSWLGTSFYSVVVAMIVGVVAVAGLVLAVSHARNTGTGD